MRRRLARARAGCERAGDQGLGTWGRVLDPSLVASPRYLIDPQIDFRMLPQRDRQLVRARKLLEMSQREVLEEKRGGAVQQRPPQAFRPTNDVDETALVQGLEHAADVHAADFLDLRPPDGLTVGDDGERLQRGRGEPLGTRRELRAFDCFGVLGAREDLPAATDLGELDTMALRVIVQPELVERRRNGGRRGLRIER